MQPASICVYCGAHHGRRPAYARQARALGSEIARRHIRLIYGGGNVGLMKVLADAVLASGGKVSGVIPRWLIAPELAHPDLTELIVVETLHERKERMYELSQAFVALPGGFGTMDEMIEMLTWSRLGLHHYPCAFLDQHDYYQPLRHLMEHMCSEGFVPDGNLHKNIWFGEEISTLFHWMDTYQSGLEAR